MKIIQKLRRAQEEQRTCWSFEYLPPKTEQARAHTRTRPLCAAGPPFPTLTGPGIASRCAGQGVENLYERMDRMYDLGPEFVAITWGAGGRTSKVALRCPVAVPEHVARVVLVPPRTVHSPDSAPRSSAGAADDGDLRQRVAQRRPGDVHASDVHQHAQGADRRGPASMWTETLWRPPAIQLTQRVRFPH